MSEVSGFLAKADAMAAEIRGSVTKSQMWPQMEQTAARLTAPIVRFAHGTLRTFPSLRKLEWLLEIERLTKIHPVMLTLTLAFVMYRGLKVTSLGHIGTDTLIYPFIGAVSYFNPFLGILSGAAYGVGDLAQKLVKNDIYGATGTRGLNYWGAMLGYVLAYSSLMMIGVLPGVLARVFRKLAGQFIPSPAGRADGAILLATSMTVIAASRSLGELFAGIAGAAIGGKISMGTLAPLLEWPAFFLRPDEDAGCHALEVNTYLKGRATTAGMGGPGILGPLIDILTGGTALVTGGGGDKKEEEGGDKKGDDKKDEKKGGRPNPCQGEVDRAFKARAKRNFADTQLAQMRARVTSLDTAYEQIRMQGYGGGVIDIGFMIASTITAGATAPIAQGLAEKLAEAAAMGLIKDQMKGLVKVLSGDKYTQADMVAALQAMPPNMAQKFLEEMMAGEALTSMMEKGLNPPGFDRNTKLLSEELTGPIAKSFMDSLSLLDTMATSNDYLDQMALSRKMISNTEQAINAIEHELQFNINPEIDSAHEGVTYCQSGDEYQRYLKGLAFDALPSQG